MIDIEFNKDVWNKIADYYYDHVHWNDEVPSTTISKWIHQEYGATLDINWTTITFETPSKRNWFLLRWGL